MISVITLKGEAGMHKQPRLVSSYLRTRRYRKNAGFTLVELLLVMVILVALAAVVLPKFSGRSEQARETAAIAQINAFETVLDSFEVDNGYYPEGPDGLIDLVEQPPDADNWHGPYLKEIPLCCSTTLPFSFIGEVLSELEDRRTKP